VTPPLGLLVSGLAAHGVAGRQDLPIPFAAVVIGAALAVVATFTILARAWPQSRLRGDAAGTPVPGALTRLLDSRGWEWGWRLAGLAVVGWIGLAALFGPDDALNPTAGFLYVVLWVGILVIASAVLGPVWPALNPIRTLLLLLRTPQQRRAMPGIGLWPAAVALAGFAWLELVAPQRATLPVINGFVTGYLVVMLAGSLWFGRQWLDVADGFEVYSRLMGRLSFLGRRSDGVAVRRNPLDGLDGTPAVPGLAAVTVVLIGSTAYDGLSNAPGWIRIAQAGTLPQPLVGSLGLAAAITLAAAAYLLATRTAGRLGGAEPAAMPRLFAHSLIPIAFGYAIAHYYSLLMIVGQQTVQRASDPLGTGADYLGLAERGIDLTWVQPTTVATIQVAAVVGGHILGALLAHDRAVRVLPADPVRGQIPLLTVMVGFTVAALLLLFAA
jgi:hypothetical protein